jgi:hypothetical protein
MAMKNDGEQDIFVFNNNEICFCNDFVNLWHIGGSFQVGIESFDVKC